MTKPRPPSPVPISPDHRCGTQWPLRSFGASCLLGGALLLTLLLSSCQRPSSAGAMEEQNVADDQQQSGPWIELFDDEHIESWQRINFGGSESHSVQTGQIEVEMGRPVTGIRFDTEDFPTKDYVLELDAKKIQGTDFFCCLTFPVNDTHCSLVVGGWGGTVTGISCINRMDASDNATTSVKKYHVGQWYKIRVQVQEKQISCWIDDQQIVDLSLEDIELGLRIEVEPCKPLGLSSFETAAAWKNLRYKRLK